MQLIKKCIPCNKAGFEYIPLNDGRSVQFEVLTQNYFVHITVEEDINGKINVVEVSRLRRSWINTTKIHEVKHFWLTVQEYLNKDSWCGEKVRERQIYFSLDEI